jgi:FkbM family methyltransferase
MEGNECYKFSTIRHYIERNSAPSVRVILDVGANVGTVTCMMTEYFPDAIIHAFEPVEEYFELGRYNTRFSSRIHWIQAAVSMQHKYADDFGLELRSDIARLMLLKASPEGGPGWGGGSMVVPQDHPVVTNPSGLKGYELRGQSIPVCELECFLDERGICEVDILKIDCEGCEHHVLGCASISLLSRLRFITGEYHDIERFYRVMRAKLFLTHKVNLIGTRQLGCFFAERLEGTRDGVLCFDKTGMLQKRLWLVESEPIEWHLFNQEYVLESERWFHAIV